MPTNAMGREAASPGKGVGGGGRKGSNAEKDREAARSLKDSLGAAADAGLGGSFGGVGGSPTRDAVQQQDQIGANVSEALNDYNDTDNSVLDDVGNIFAGLAGFHELDPSAPGYSQPGAPGTTGQADWGFDVLAGAAGLAGIALGVPGLGLAVGAAEEALGIQDDLSANLGPQALVDDDEGYVGTAALNSVPNDGSASEDGASAAADEEDATDDWDSGSGQGDDHMGAGLLDDETPASVALMGSPRKKPAKRSPSPAPGVPTPFSTIALKDVVSLSDYFGV